MYKKGQHWRKNIKKAEKIPGNASYCFHFLLYGTQTIDAVVRVHHCSCLASCSKWYFSNVGNLLRLSFCTNGSQWDERFAYFEMKIARGFTEHLKRISDKWWDKNIFANSIICNFYMFIYFFLFNSYNFIIIILLIEFGAIFSLQKLLSLFEKLREEKCKIGLMNITNTMLIQLFQFCINKLIIPAYLLLSSFELIIFCDSQNCIVILRKNNLIHSEYHGNRTCK